MCNLLLIINASIIHLLRTLPCHCPGAKRKIICSCVTPIQDQIIRYFFKCNNFLKAKMNSSLISSKLVHVTLDLVFPCLFTTFVCAIMECAQCLEMTLVPPFFTSKLSIFALYSTFHCSNHNCGISKYSIGM